MDNDGRSHVIRRAQQCGVALERLALEPASEDDERFLVSVIVGGALDSEFSLGDTMYEVNIADWLAERFRGNVDPACDPSAAEGLAGGESWQIIVSDMAGDTHYSVSDESGE
ncbi:MAG: hypothetical protein M3N52_12050 [Actinomycetota bacterium]|nr:hypothetical protein [Actinomycetota bacterium]